MIFQPFDLRTVALAFVAFSSFAAEPRDTMSDTWAATDGLGRVLPMSAEVGAVKANRTVGIFYFNWHAAFGNKEVHDIAKILAANPAAPPWGPVQAPHYWSEPRFGYYRPNDPWVLRKHAQILADAGVDVIIFDVTFPTSAGTTYVVDRPDEPWETQPITDIPLTPH
jgi:hypothetical protein